MQLKLEFTKEDKEWNQLWIDRNSMKLDQLAKHLKTKK